MNRLLLGLLLVPTPVAAQAMLGPDAAACRASEGPAIQVDATGLKDRTGDL